MVTINLKSKFLYQSIRQIYRYFRKKFKLLISIGCTDTQWARVVINMKTQCIINNLSLANLRTLEISGDYWKQTNFKSYKNVFYPDFDICESKLDEKFDLIIAEQVFEHLLRPYHAGKNVYKMLNQGGYFLITTPFLIRVHEFPNDCSRWTETGIKYLLNEFGFELNNIQTGSWGNRACIKGNFSKWKLYNPWYHSLKNESEFPVVVWALAKK